MKYTHALFAALMAITLMSACTQEQQRTISDLNLDRELNDGIKRTEEATASAGAWLDSEIAIWSLRFKVQRATGNENVSAEQIASLNHSLSYIEDLQKQSIKSGDGITESERAQILAAVDRVRERLDGWIASSSPSNVQ
jgi:hypothetical protein